MSKGPWCVDTKSGLWEKDAVLHAWTCASCGFPGSDDEMVDSYDRDPSGGTVEVKVHIDCLDDWANRDAEADDDV